MSLMTLDEAIQHCRDRENCSQCGQEHKQLREWLEELKELRSQYNLPKPHSRLIDADRLIEYINKELKGDEYIQRMFRRIVKSRATIIEAEMK